MAARVQRGKVMPGVMGLHPVRTIRPEVVAAQAQRGKHLPGAARMAGTAELGIQMLFQAQLFGTQVEAAQGEAIREVPVSAATAAVAMAERRTLMAAMQSLIRAAVAAVQELHIQIMYAVVMVEQESLLSAIRRLIN